MVIMLVGIIFILPEVSKNIKYLGCLAEKLLSGTSTYLEDVLHPPKVPDDDPDGWDHIDLT